MKKKQVQGLRIGLLSKVRKSILIVETKMLGITMYRVEGRSTATIYCETIKVAKLFADNARLSMARDSFKKKERIKKEKVINL
jgi:hypothetical protein